MNVQDRSEVNKSMPPPQSHSERTEDDAPLTKGNLRAREILDLLKAKRERYTGRLQQSIISSSSRTSTEASPPTNMLPSAEKPPLASVEKNGVARQDSMDRRKMFVRSFQKSPTNSHYSLDGSEATKHSAGTRSTVPSDDSYSMSSPGSVDGMINRSIHVLACPKAPMLHEIREVASFNAGAAAAPKEQQPETTPVASNDELDQTDSNLTAEADDDAVSSTCSSSPSFHDADINTQEKLRTEVDGTESPLNQLKADEGEIVDQSASSLTEEESSSSEAELPDCPTSQGAEPASKVADEPKEQEKTPLPEEKEDDQTGCSDEAEIANLLLPVKSFDTYASATEGPSYAVIPPTGSNARPSSGLSIAANVPLPDSVPVTPTTPRTFDDNTSRPMHDRPPKLLTFADVHIPQELTPLGNHSVSSARSADNSPISQTRKRRPAVRSRRGHSLPARKQSPSTVGGSFAKEDEAGASSSSSLLTLGTKEERAAYIGQLYRSEDASGKNKMITPPVTPSAGLRRHERDTVNRQMVRGRVGVLKNTSQKVFITEENDQIEGAAPGKSNSEIVPTERPSWERKKRTEISKHRAIEKEFLDISIVNDHEKRRELLRRLQEDLQQAGKEEIEQISQSRSASPSSTSSSDYIVISDDSSCDLTTSSELTDCFMSFPSSRQSEAHRFGADATAKQMSDQRTIEEVSFADMPAPAKEVRVKDPMKEVTFECDKAPSEISGVTTKDGKQESKDQHRTGLKLTAWRRPTCSQPTQEKRGHAPPGDERKATDGSFHWEDPSEISMFSLEASPEIVEEVGVHKKVSIPIFSSQSQEPRSSRSPSHEHPTTTVNQAQVQNDDETKFSQISFEAPLNVIEEPKMRAKVPKSKARKSRKSSSSKSKAKASKATCSTSPSTSSKQLFVTGRAADALCMASGGLYDLAKRSGMVLESGPKVELVRLPIPPVKPASMRLSTDFRCGAYGSHYDIAVRSGCNIHEPLPFTARRPRPKCRSAPSSRSSSRDSVCSERSTKSEAGFIPAHGGIHDTAMRSGLTKSKLRSRTPLSIRTKQQPANSKQRSTEVVPEEISDSQCGANGTLSMLLGGGSTLSTPLLKANTSLYAIKEVEGVELD